MPKNTVCHIEFDSTDLKRSRAFYQGLFEWTFKEFGPEMVVFGVGDSHIGGLQKSNNVSASQSPSVWIEVDELEGYLAKAPALGGSVLRDKHEIPSVGWSAVLADPDGNHVGLVQFHPKSA